MNVNEECLLQFLNNPDRLDITTKNLTKYILFKNTENISTAENMQKELKIINAR